MNTTSCKFKPGCVELKLHTAQGEAWSWYKHLPFVKLHEKLHADTYHNTSFIPTKDYAKKLEHCYKTKEEATCWQHIAEEIVPKVNYLKAELANLAIDGITSGPLVSGIQALLATEQASLATEEGKCASP